MAGTLDTAPLDAALAAAIRRYVEAQRRSLATAPRCLETVVLLRRLGLDEPALRDALAAQDPARLPGPLRERLRERLAAELGRLSRQARSGDSRYDLTRHIAVRRLASWLAGHPVARGDPADERSPGRVLNARFVRRQARAAKERRRSA